MGRHRTRSAPTRSGRAQRGATARRSAVRLHGAVAPEAAVRRRRASAPQPALRLTRRGRLVLTTTVFAGCVALVLAALGALPGWRRAPAPDQAAAQRAEPPDSAAAGAGIVPSTPTPASDATPAPATVRRRSDVRPIRVPNDGTGRLVTVPGRGPVVGKGPLRRYIVEVERGTGQQPKAFADAVERTLADRRSWGAGGRLSFQRVDSGPVDFRVVLATPGHTDRLCAPLDTDGEYSCYQGVRAVVNLRRWLLGSPGYGGDLASYRNYVVNHEVGHALGHGHHECPRRGDPAPVMVQQTVSLGGCRPNPWPYPDVSALTGAG